MDPLHQIVLLIIAASLLFTVIGYLRARGRSAAGYATLLAAALGLTAFAAYRQPVAAWLFFTCCGLFVYLVLVPGVLVGAIRRALRDGNWRRALGLARLRRVFQPGAGTGGDLRVLAGLSLVSEGRLDEATAEVRQQLDSPLAQRDQVVRLALIEQQLTLLGFGRRFDEAVALFEAQGGTALATGSVGVCVTMIRAYAEVGALDRAAQCLAILEESPAALSPASASGVNGARLALAAHLGLVDHVERILAIPPSFLPGLEPAHVALWRGLALARLGERERAEAELRSVADGDVDPQVAGVARQRLAEDLDRRVEPAEAFVELIETSTVRAETYRGVPRTKGKFWRLAPVTAALLAVVAVVHVANEIVGASRDPWLLLRFGANFRMAVVGGEIWRLVSSMFLHGGMLHFLLNAYALFLLGRLTEQMLGSARFFCVYLLAGVCGSVASVYHGGATHLSVGASGAIFGLVGAALVGLRQLSGKVPEEWRRQLSINLLVIIGIQLYIGYTVKVIDNAAHIGGLLGGALFTFVLPPAREAGRRRLIAVLAVLLLGVTVASGVAAALSGPEAMLSRMPRKTLGRGGLSVRVPAHWERGKEGGMLSARDPLVGLVQPPTLELRAVSPSLRSDLSLADELRGDLRAARDAWAKVKQVQRAEILGLQQPAWARTGAELQVGTLRLVVDDHRYINTNILRRQGDLILVARVFVPEQLLSAYAPILGEIARSMRFKE